MDLEDILEVIGKIFAIIGLALLVGLSIALLAYCALGWILAVVAFFYGKVVLGIALLMVWLIVSGARLSW
jgi:hypothetical protein